MKRDNTEKKRVGSFEPPSDAIFHGRPALADACCNPFWDDKSVKGCWTLSMSWESGQCQVSITDKDEKRSINTTSETAEEALELVEKLLASDRRPWRYWGGKARK